MTLRGWGLLLLALGISCAQPPAPATGLPVDYATQVRPLLEQHCYACHGSDLKAPSGRLRLQTRQQAEKGGRSGVPAIIAGDSAASPLVLSMTGRESDTWRRMPPPGAPALTREEIRLIERWIDEGAVWPDSD